MVFFSPKSRCPEQPSTYRKLLLSENNPTKPCRYNCGGRMFSPHISMNHHPDQAKWLNWGLKSNTTHRCLCYVFFKCSCLTTSLANKYIGEISVLTELWAWPNVGKTLMFPFIPHKKFMTIQVKKRRTKNIPFEIHKITPCSQNKLFSCLS